MMSNLLQRYDLQHATIKWLKQRNGSVLNTLNENSRSKRETANARTGLLRLPTENFNQIILDVAQSAAPVNVPQQHARSTRSEAILQTCRQIRIQASGIFWANVGVRLMLGAPSRPWKLEYVEEWLSQMEFTMGRVYIESAPGQGRCSVSRTLYINKKIKSLRYTCRWCAILQQREREAPGSKPGLCSCQPTREAADALLTEGTAAIAADQLLKLVALFRKFDKDRDIRHTIG